MKNVGNSSRRRSQSPENFRAPMYRAHCAVIFAIAQLSCTLSDDDDDYSFRILATIPHPLPQFSIPHVTNDRAAAASDAAAIRQFTD